MANIHGLLSVIIGVFIPLMIWVFGMQKWTPRTRGLYAFKMSLYPIILLTFLLGGPISGAILGLQRPSQMDFSETLEGLVGLAIFLTPITYGVVWLLSAKKTFPDERE